jgi:dTMP kinase
VPGLFITLEGIEGSGKTTQAERLAESLESEGLAVLRTREPGGTELAEKIRDLVLNKEKEPVHAETELLLFLAARAQHVRERIRPALERGEIVICDRFSDATRAYQGAGRRIGESALGQFDVWATGGLTPHRTYLIDIPVADGIARAKHRQGLRGIDRIESEGAGFLGVVREAYLRIAKEEPGRIFVLDGLLPPEALAKTILNDVKSMLSSRQPTTQKGSPS